MVLVSNSWIIDLTILLILVIYLIYRYMIRNFDYWKRRGVVHISPIPFFGNFYEFVTAKKSIGQFLKDLYDYAPDEPYVGFFGFDKPMLLIRDTNIIKQILTKDFRYFKDRYANSGTHDTLGYANLFILKNPAWKYVRTKITPIYTSGKLKKMFDLMTEVGQDLKKHLESLNLKDSGRRIEIKELCSKLTTDMIATTAFGLRANSLNNPHAEFRKYGMEIFEKSFYRSIEQTATFFAPHLMTPLRFNIFSKRVANFFRQAVWDAIDAREKSQAKRHDLIDLLIQLKNQDAERSFEEFKFAGDNLVSQAALFFTAGFETSSTPLAFSLYELALNPKIQDRLRREITDALDENAGKVTYEMVTKLPYLDMVISEALRKYPPLPILDRVADSNYTIPSTNLVIEKGTPVYIGLMGLHHDPNYHRDPEKFDPERFSDANKEITNKAYLPYGDGPHVCIGLRIGLLEAKLGLIEILSQYEFHPCEETLIPMKLSRLGVMTHPDGGLYLNIKRIVK